MRTSTHDTTCLVLGVAASVLLLGGLSSCRKKGRELKDHELGKIQQHLDLAKKRGATYDRARRKALVRLHAARVPRSAKKSCERRIPTPDDASRRGSADGAWASDPRYRLFNIVSADKVAAAPGPLTTRLKKESENQLRDATGGDADPALQIKLANRLTGSKYWDQDATLVADEWIRPKMAPDGIGFSPGRIRGRLYLYDYRRGAFICAADVDARSSDAVSSSELRSLDVQADLKINAILQGLKRLSGLDTARPRPSAAAKHRFVFPNTSGDARVKMRFARILRLGDGVTLILADTANPTCQHFSQPRWRHSVSLYLFPGAGGRFFGSGSVGGRGLTRAGDTGTPVPAQFAWARFTSTRLEPGARIKGRLTVPTLGAWDFDATVCPGDYRVEHPLPAQAPNRAASGVIGGRPFRVRSALALVKRWGKARFVKRIALYSRKGIGCQQRNTPPRGTTALYLEEIGGASTLASLRGSHQVAHTKAIRYGTKKSGFFGQTWVQLDTLAFAPGSQIRGRLVVKSKPSVPRRKAIRVSGTFDAEVCLIP